MDRSTCRSRDLLRQSHASHLADSCRPVDGRRSDLSNPESAEGTPGYDADTFCYAGKEHPEFERARRTGVHLCMQLHEAQETRECRHLFPKVVRMPMPTSALERQNKAATREERPYKKPASDERVPSNTANHGRRGILGIRDEHPCLAMLGAAHDWLQLADRRFRNRIVWAEDALRFIFAQCSRSVSSLPAY